MSQSLFTVSIYDTLSPSATEFIVNHAELNCIVASLDVGLWTGSVRYAADSEISTAYPHASLDKR